MEVPSKTSEEKIPTDWSIDFIFVSMWHGHVSVCQTSLQVAEGRSPVAVAGAGKWMKHMRKTGHIILVIAWWRIIMATRYSVMQIVRNSQDAENKENKVVLVLEKNLQNFSFLCSAFCLGEFSPAALVKQRWLQSGALQLHPPLLGLQTPTFLLLLCLPFVFKHRSSINYNQHSPIVLIPRAQHTALRAGPAQLTSASPLMRCQAHRAYSSPLLIRTNPCFLAGYLFPLTWEDGILFKECKNIPSCLFPNETSSLSTPKQSFLWRQMVTKLYKTLSSILQPALVLNTT